MKNKILFYVNGGGLGHLSRTAAFIYTEQIDANECIILSSSPYAHLFFPMHSINVVPNHLAFNVQELASFLQKQIECHSFEAIYIDTFPLGIIGELQYVDFKNIKLFYLARYLKWELYRELIKTNSKILFSHTFLFEELSAEHLSFTLDNSVQYSNLQLIYPPKEIPEHLKLKLSSKPNNQNWLIVHSTPADEVFALIEHAKDLAQKENKQVIFHLATQTEIELPNEIERINFFPAYALFPYVDRIITACGFNLMQQTQSFRSKHIAVPFPRQFDNQFLRFTKMKKASKN